MTGLTVKYKVSFTNGAAAPKPGPTKLARRLALAHAVDRLVEAGVLRSYAEAAEMLGITRASLAVIVGLLVLSPNIQEAILDGGFRPTKWQLEPVLERGEWKDQAHLLATTKDIDRCIYNSRGHM